VSGLGNEKPPAAEEPPGDPAPEQGNGGNGPVRVREVVQRLTVLGLSEAEAATYVHLTMVGPAKASDVAAALHLHRSEAYRTLQRLSQRGFVAATLSRPTRFEAAPPERLFRELQEAERSRAEHITQARGSLGADLEALRAGGSEDFTRAGVRVIQGRREIYRHLERMVRAAKAELRAVSTHEHAVGMSELAGILDIAVARAGEGLTLRAVVRSTATGAARRAGLPKVEGAEVRALDTPRVMRFVIADKAELLLWVVSDPSQRLASEKDVALWTDAADLVGLQGLLFEAVWRAAGPVDGGEAEALAEARRSREAGT